VPDTPEPQALPETPSKPAPKPSPEDLETQKKPPLPSPAPVLPADRLAINFYNTEITLKYDRLWKRSTPIRNVKPATIKSSWDFFSKTDYASFLEQALYVKEAMALNDWGYCRLINTAAKHLFPENYNRRPIFIWFMLVQSGYDMRIGYNDNSIFVLFPTPQTVYGAQFYEYENRKYYITSLGNDYGTEVSSLFTYEGSHKEAVKAIDFSFAASPKIGKREEQKSLQFEYTGKAYKFDVTVNGTLIDYLDSYPQVDLDVYFGAPLSEAAEQSLVDGLKPIIDGKSETEAANIILRFVQTSLAYQTDDEQFQEENYLFSDESLYFPYCDCEDRSFLFSNLIRKLLGLEVIGLQYPGHIATAVKFSKSTPGTYVTFDGERYIICDPTYINADIGQSMPQFSTVKPGIIRTVSLDKN